MIQLLSIISVGFIMGTLFPLAIVSLDDWSWAIPVLVVGFDIIILGVLAAWWILTIGVKCCDMSVEHAKNAVR